MKKCEIEKLSKESLVSIIMNGLYKVKSRAFTFDQWKKVKKLETESKLRKSKIELIEEATTTIHTLNTLKNESYKTALKRGVKND